MSKETILNNTANAVDSQTEMLCALLMHMKMLTAQIEQMQLTIAINSRPCQGLNRDCNQEGFIHGAGI